MRRYNSKYYIYERLKLVLDYCFVFTIPRGAWIVASIMGAKLLRRPYIRLPMPGSRRTIRLRTNSSDIATYNKIFVRREYDFSYLPQAARFSSGPDPIGRSGQEITIVDCGANVGCSVLWFAEEFPGAEILAVEPDLANFELLKQNVAGLDKVRVIRAALWSGETRLVIANPDDEPWAFRTEAVTESMDENRALIDTVTMDRLLSNYSPPTSLIIKIDIEGAEREVFSKKTSWLGLVDLLIIELHDVLFPWQANSGPFFSAVAAKSMDYIWQAENLFCFQIREPDSQRLNTRQDCASGHDSTVGSGARA